MNSLFLCLSCSLQTYENTKNTRFFSLYYLVILVCQLGGIFMTKAVIIFFISLAVYFVGLGIFVLVKFIRNKRRIKKDLENAEIEEGNENGEDKNQN